MANEIVVSEQAAAFLPVMPLAIAVQRRDSIVQFTKQIMVRDTDYGVVPGTGSKPSLLKPGAEKLCSFFGLAPVFVPVETVQDWTGKEHDGEAFFLYRYRCELYRNGVMVGSGIGSCNSWESKYRYRTAEKVCPNCHQPAIIAGKAEYGGGWVCFKKKGGCGAKFPENHPAIVNQPSGKVANPDPADIVNTVDKMAQKRALVAATLIAVNASEFFTQDIEDMASGFVDAEYRTVTDVTPTQAPAPAPAPQATNGNGHDNPFIDAEDEAGRIVATWTQPSDAYAWAVEIGACHGIPHARNALERVVREEFNGKFTAKNAGMVYRAFFADRVAAALAQADVNEPLDVDMEAAPELAH